MEGFPIAVYMCNPKGEITFYNHAAATLWGREPEAGKDIWCGSWKVYDSDGAKLLPNKYPAALALTEKSPHTPEEIIVERPDASRIHVQPYITTITDIDGSITGVLVTLTDTTEKHKNKLLSQQLEQKIDEVQDYSILLLDSNGYIISWNKGAEKIKGYKENEILGKSFSSFYLNEDRENNLPETFLEKARAKGRAKHEGWRIRKDGTKFWGCVVITALHDEHNNIIGFSKVTRDLTERKLSEDQLKNYALDIEFRSKQLEEYAYIASHDLQEPLRKIQVFGEMLENSLEDKEAMLHYIEKINSSARRMTTLIKDVLKYSQLSRAEELFETTNLNVILQNVLEDFDLLIEQQNVTIVGTILPTLKGIPIQLHQLFSNLISNSIKFRKPNPLIEIFTETPGEDEIENDPLLNSGTPYVKIIFKDNGLGFEQQYDDQIFKMFKRLGNTPGTGIGLALCKKIVENHNGSISVTSQPNEGTTFTIFMPLV
ncbi:Phytochrome-like protein cph1 [compost metagenome]